MKGGRATVARLASAACNCRVLRALDLFFKWLLKKSELQAGAARLAFNVGPHAATPCRDIEKAEPKRDPEITEVDKRRILGENQAKLFGIDVAQKKRELAAAA